MPSIVDTTLMTHRSSLNFGSPTPISNRGERKYHVVSHGSTHDRNIIDDNHFFNDYFHHLLITFRLLLISDCVPMKNHHSMLAVMVLVLLGKLLSSRV